MPVRNLHILLSLTLCVLLGGQACRPAIPARDPASEVRAALAAYDTLILHMDAAAIGQAFAPDGESSDADQPPLHGPDAIRAHLEQFAGFQVLANHLEADSTRVHGDTAWQEGSYSQRVRVPAGDTIEVGGRFEVTWVKAGPKGWLIRRMHTFRPPTASSASSALVVDTGRVAVPGSSLYYERAGHGAPVVLLHSGFLDRRIWDPLFLPLARTHLVIRYDARGLGRSGSAHAPFSHAEDLGRLLQALDLPRVSLVGNSLGGATALDFAVAHPEKVDRLVLVGPGLSGFPWGPTDLNEPWRIEARAAIARGDTVAAARAWLHSSYLLPASRHPSLAASLDTLLGDNVRYWRELLHNNRQTWDTEPDLPTIARLGSITEPVLIVQGESDDADILRITDTLMARIPTATRVLLPGVGHLPSLEAADTFNALVIRFLTAPR